MTTQLGSYKYGEFRNNSVELARLKEQASVGLHLEREMWKHLGLNPDAAVLDLGSGPGVVSAELARMVPSGSVLGVDANSAMIEVAEAVRADGGLGNLRFALGDASDLDLPDNSFDFLYARFLFQHLAQPEKVAAEIVRVLRPGGRACIVDVDDQWLTLHPEPVRFRAFLAAVSRAQRAQGGDRLSGRKLSGYLKGAGLARVGSGATTVTSDELGIELLVKLVTGFKQELFAEKELDAVQEDLADVLSILKHPSAWGAVAVFYAHGVKDSAPPVNEPIG